MPDKKRPASHHGRGGVRLGAGNKKEIGWGADKISMCKRQWEMVNGRVNINGSPHTLNYGTPAITGEMDHDGEGVAEAGGWACFNIMLSGGGCD